MINLAGLSRNQLTRILSTHYAKYLSQHDPTRHYIINYNRNGLFKITTHEHNVQLGMGHGKYTIRDTKSGAMMDIQYKRIYDSPNITSPMNPHNSFYPSLLKGYSIGPFYTHGLDTGAMWQPVLYSHLQKERAFKVLNFYRR